MIPMTPPEILALATRWSARVRFGNGEGLTADELNTLLAWLRKFMRERHEGYVRARLRAGARPDGLGLHSTRDPVSRDVAVALGFTTNPFEVQHGTIVWLLCGLAGWQDGQGQANA